MLALEGQLGGDVAGVGGIVGLRDFRSREAAEQRYLGGDGGEDGAAAASGRQMDMGHRQMGTMQNKFYGADKADGDIPESKVIEFFKWRR